LDELCEARCSADQSLTALPAALGEPHGPR
jgi:hypothetical protein